MHPVPLPVPDQALTWIRAVGERLLVVFKQSPTCGNSRVALRAFENYLASTKAQAVDADFAVVDVLGQRPVSQAIAKATGVTHESPQVLLIKNGMCVWHTSHISISEASLERQIGLFSAPPKAKQTV